MVTFNSLTSDERQQFSELCSKIRADLPFSPKPAANYVKLARGRVCAALNYSIDHNLADIRVDRSGPVDLYYHI